MTAATQPVPTVGPLAVAGDAYREGFDDIDEYLQWLALEGRRSLRLLVREMPDGDGQLFDRLSEVQEPEATSAGVSSDTTVLSHEQPIGRCGFGLRAVRCIERVLVRHSSDRLSRLGARPGRLASRRGTKRSDGAA